MKTTILATVAVLSAAALSFVTFEHTVQGQPQNEQPQNEQEQPIPLLASGEPKEGIQLSISMDRNVFTPKEPVLMTVSLKNLNRANLSLPTTTPERDFKLSVKDKQGNILPLSLYGKGMNTSAIFGRYPVEVKIGKQTQYTLQIDRLYDLTTCGSYSIEASRRVPNINGNGFSDVTSGKIDVSIVEPTADDGEGGSVTPGEVENNENM